MDKDEIFRKLIELAQEVADQDCECVDENGEELSGCIHYRAFELKCLAIE